MACAVQADTCEPYVCEKKNPSHCSMDIYAPEGHRVKVVTATLGNGQEWQRKLVNKHLKLNKEYTIQRTHVSSSSTNVFLKEVEGIMFNSVNFVDVCILSESIKQEHPDWIRYQRRLQERANK